MRPQPHLFCRPRPWNWLRQAGAATALAFAAWLPSSAAQAQSVVFINPGKTGELFWETASTTMRHAARSLDMKLEVIMAERERLAPIHIAQQIAARPKAQRPDYVIFSNEYSVGPAVLRALEGSGIRSFMAFNGLSIQLRSQTDAPRSRQHALWLGSLEPDAHTGGYLTAKALIEQGLNTPQLQRAPNGQLQLLAIAGDRSTPSSAARNAGMQLAVQESAGKVQLMQEVYSDWRKDKAYEQMRELKKRYPDARLVWAGSDQMAFGAMQAWRDAQGQPGQDALFSAINTSDDAFAALSQGQLSALAGGHVLCGAWSMVLLHDHYKGIDFADEGLEIRQPMFMLFDAQTAKAFSQRLVHTQATPDFRRFSKHHNRDLQRYHFDLQQLLQ